MKQAEEKHKRTELLLNRRYVVPFEESLRHYANVCMDRVNLLQKQVAELQQSRSKLEVQLQESTKLTQELQLKLKLSAKESPVAAPVAEPVAMESEPEQPESKMRDRVESDDTRPQKKAKVTPAATVAAEESVGGVLPVIGWLFLC